MRVQVLTEDFKTPFGELVLASFNGELVLCDWKYRKMRTSIDNRIKKGIEAMVRASGFEKNQTQNIDSLILEQTRTQLNEYFEGNRTDFNIPVRAIATDFQERVWDALCEIPFGETRTYLQLSEILGDTKAIRAVASANGANAHSIIIPCHRVIGSNGELTGYAGGLPAKQKLLELENPNRKSQLDLF